MLFRSLLVCLSSDDDDDDSDEEYLKMPMILSVPPKSLSPPAADSDYDSFSGFEVRKLHTTTPHHILTSNETRGASKREYHADLKLPYSSSIPNTRITRETDSDSSEEEIEITDKQPLKLAAARKYLSSEDDDSSDDDLLFNSVLRDRKSVV